RRRLPEHDHQAARLIAVLPRPDSARDRDHHEPYGSGDRAPVRRASVGDLMSATLDATAPLTASGNLRRRMFVSRVFTGAAVLSAMIAVTILFVVVFGVAKQGASALSLDFIIKNPVGLAGGGIANAIIGTALIVL